MGDAGGRARDPGGTIEGCLEGELVEEEAVIPTPPLALEVPVQAESKKSWKQRPQRGLLADDGSSPPSPFAVAHSSFLSRWSLSIDTMLSGVASVPAAADDLSIDADRARPCGLYERTYPSSLDRNRAVRWRRRASCDRRAMVASSSFTGPCGQSLAVTHVDRREQHGRRKR